MAVSGADVEKIKEGIGYGIPPKNAENLVATGFGGKAQLSWTIGDTEINGQVICTLKGCIIRKKQGSAPQSLEDGTLVATLNREQAMSYSEVPYEDPQSIGTSSDWYYRLFFYSDHDVFNLDDRNVVKVRGTARAKIWGFRQDFSNLNPDSQITYIEDASGFTPAYYNTGSRTNGSWNNWEWFTEMKPYIVEFSSGKSIYELNPLDLNELKDGTQVTANICDGYTNGIFTWIPKIYIKEEYSGKVRTLKFSLTNRDPRTKDFKLSRIFKGKDGEELEGFWMPYSPVGYRKRNLFGNDPYSKHNIRIAHHRGLDSILYMKFTGFNSNYYSAHWGYAKDALEISGNRGALLGVDFFTFFRDIFYLLFKSTNQISKFGHIRSAGENGEFPYQAPLLKPLNLKSQSSTKGIFSIGEIAFYSRVLTSHENSGMVDFYIRRYQNHDWYMEYPKVSFSEVPNTAEGWIKIDKGLASNRSSSTWLSGLEHTNIGLSIPTQYTKGGSSSTGLCAAWTLYDVSQGMLCWGDNVTQQKTNIAGTANKAITFSGSVNELTSFAITVIAPVGYKPI